MSAAAPQRGALALLAAVVVAAAAALLGMLVGAGPAAASNTRVSIANYVWSNPSVHINLGEKVTWDWLGPDTAHSVTGVSPNAIGIDSDPGTDVPRHQPGDSFTVQFNTAGTYQFRCKLHSFVRGEVIVSETPGEPNSDPGPQPPLNVDETPPTLGSVSLPKKTVSGTKGIHTSAQISEPGTLEAEYFRYNSKGKRVYNGYTIWHVFRGINYFGLGKRWKHFKAKPGRYQAVLRATDESNNTSKSVKKRFRISG